LSRRQLILFSSLLIIPIILLLLSEPISLALSARLATVLLFPVTAITRFIEFSALSSARLEELEIMVNRLELENGQLKNKISIDTTEFRSSNFKLLKARISGRDPSNINGYLYIDKGKEQGLFVNQPVISISGLIGRVKFVGDHHSIVETIENQGFAVSGLDIKSGIHGIIKQRVSLIFDYVRATNEIDIGDSIYTSGMSEIFPAGILIGTVQEIQQAKDLFFKKVYVKPSTQVNRLTSVYLIFGSETQKPPKVFGLTSQ